MAFREQTAGHNALLLFVHLALSMMEERLRNAFKELRAKEAEARFLHKPTALIDPHGEDAMCLAPAQAGAGAMQSRASGGG